MPTAPPTCSVLAETLYGRLLRNLGFRDRTAVVSDNSTQNECTAGNRDMIAEYRSLNRTALVVYRTDRACRVLLRVMSVTLLSVPTLQLLIIP